MRVHRLALVVLVASSSLAVGVATLLHGEPALEPHGVAASDARSWFAAPLLAFAIVGTMGCLVGALAAGSRRAR